MKIFKRIKIKSAKSISYYLEKITGNNRRSGMPLKGFIVRYEDSDVGWKYARVFEDLDEANDFIESLKNGIIPKK